MKATFCRTFCGTCARCLEALEAVEREEAVYASLSEEDRDSLMRRDPDDPRTYALDHKGRP